MAGKSRQGSGSQSKVGRTRAVFMISVAAELADMHPQTLRMYEMRGLVRPGRSAKGTRLYSEVDIERLRRIQEMTVELGMNLAGVEKVFQLEAELERLTRRVERLEWAAEQTVARYEAELERVRRSGRAEVVRYMPQGTAVVSWRRR